MLGVQKIGRYEVLNHLASGGMGQVYLARSTGLGGFERQVVVKTLDLSIVDQVEAVSNDEAIAWAHRLMREEGILAGISCGAAMAAAERVANQPQHLGKTIVVILPDSGERYLSSILFEGAFSEQDLA